MAKQIICRDLEGNTYPVDANQLRFRPSVYAVIIKDDRVLLSPQWGGYDYPGGSIELGEHLEDALKREVREETGYEIKVGGLLACYESFFKMPTNGDFVHSILLYYLCDIIGGCPDQQQLDKSEMGHVDLPEWIDLETIVNIKFSNSADNNNILTEASRRITE